MIRKLKEEDLVRTAEIIVFNNRKNYYPIFRDIQYSFREYNVISVMEMFRNDPIFMDHTYVYDDNGIIMGFICVYDNEILKLYVDPFFQSKHIGTELMEHFPDTTHVWALEKNTPALQFYHNFGFKEDGNRKNEEGTDEYLIHLTKGE